MTGTKVYNIWKSMKQRCNYKKASNYRNYGGRGISVCDRWKNSFENFYKDMGNPPVGKPTIERIDNNKNYEPNNCKWATYYEQSINKRDMGKNQFKLTGVYQTRGYIYSMIVVKKRKIYLGSFNTALEAHKEYLKAKRKYHGTS